MFMNCLVCEMSQFQSIQLVNSLFISLITAKTTIELGLSFIQKISQKGFFM